MSTFVTATCFKTHRGHTIQLEGVTLFKKARPICALETPARHPWSQHRMGQRPGVCGDARTAKHVRAVAPEDVAELCWAPAQSQSATKVHHVLSTSPVHRGKLKSHMATMRRCDPRGLIADALGRENECRATTWHQQNPRRALFDMRCRVHSTDTVQGEGRHAQV